MTFEINPLAYRDIVPLPKSVIADNLNLATPIQLQVILYIFANQDEEISTEKIASVLIRPTRDDVEDARYFWTERGLLIKKGDAPTSFKTASETVAAPMPSSEIPAVAIPEKKVSPLPISRPSHEQIAVRLQECSEFAALFAEVQAVLGKTIGYDGQSVLIMMHDSYGLPFEVILMAVEYAASQKKTGFSSIAKIGRTWSELEIDSLEGAMEYIEEHSVINETWNKLRSLTDITNRTPTAKQRGYLVKWVKEYGYNADMIYYAYEECIDRTGKMSMPYMDKIISNWHQSGVKNPTDIQKEKARWAESQQSRHGKGDAKKVPPKAESDASYDLDAFAKKAVGLKYKKSGT